MCHLSNASGRPARRPYTSVVPVFFICLLLLGPAATGRCQQSEANTLEGAAPPPVDTTSTTSETTTSTLPLHGEAMTVIVVQADGDGTTLELVPGAARADGRLVLSYSALIGVPPGRLGPIEIVQVNHRLDSGEVVAEPWTRPAVKGPATEIVSVEVLGWLRLQRLARLVLHPWIKHSGSWAGPDLVSVVVRIPFLEALPEQPAPDDRGVMDRVLHEALGNATAARAYRSLPPVPMPEAAPLLPDLHAPHALLRTATTGVHALSGGELRRWGVPVGEIDPARLRLFHAGRELPLLVRHGDGSLHDGSSLYFVVPPVPAAYAETNRDNVLGLTWSDQPRRLMDLAPALQDGQAVVVDRFEVVKRVEEDRVVLESDPLLADRWFHSKLEAEPGFPDRCFLVVPGLRPVEGGSVQLRLALHGLTNPPGPGRNHHVVVELNGGAAGELLWEGKTEAIFEAELSSDQLVDGDNIVEVRLPGDLEVFADHVMVDWLELRYLSRGEGGGPFAFSHKAAEAGLVEFRVKHQRGQSVQIYEISEPTEPTLLLQPEVQREGNDMVVFQWNFEGPEKRSFAVVPEGSAARPIAVDSRENGCAGAVSTAAADLLVVAHPTLLPGLGELLDYRRAQGLVVTALSTDEVYAAFSHGYATAEAIRSFVTTAFLSRNPPPSHLLLVGDASSDPLDRLGYGAADLLPTFRLANPGGFAGASASDNHFGTLGGDDLLPELAVGRLAVTTAAQAQLVADKIINHERGGAVGCWRRRAAVVCDDRELGSRFHMLAEATMAELRGLGFEVHSLLLDELQLPASMSMAERIERTDQEMWPRLRDLWTEGVGLVHYIGHGGYRIWAREHLLDVRPGNRHLGELDSCGRLPVVLSFSCLTGGFDNPRFVTIGEALVNSSEGGAAAFWASSGSSTNIDAWQVAEALTRLGAGAGGADLGAAIILVRLETMRRKGFITTFSPTDPHVLIGDPSLRVRLFPDDDCSD